jgi:DNA-binding response OmpR family regulator
MTAARPILIIEDDPIQSDILTEGFGISAEFEIDVATTLAEADELLRTPDARIDTVILDLGMLDGDGRDYCAKLRKQGHKMPIILTGAGDEVNVVRGLEAGANDYVTKPYRLNELLARVRAQLRIFDESENAVFTIGKFAFRPAAQLLLDPKKGRRILLTGKEAAILKFLCRAGARPVGRLELLDKVWGYNSGATTRTLETHIYRLRQKMERGPAEAHLLVTSSGRYQLNTAPAVQLAAEFASTLTSRGAEPAISAAH